MPKSGLVYNVGCEKLRVTVPVSAACCGLDPPTARETALVSEESKGGEKGAVVKDRKGDVAKVQRAVEHLFPLVSLTPPLLKWTAVQS